VYPIPARKQAATKVAFYVGRNEIVKEQIERDYYRKSCSVRKARSEIFSRIFRGFNPELWRDID